MIDAIRFKAVVNDNSIRTTVEGFLKIGKLILHPLLNYNTGEVTSYKTKVKNIIFVLRDNQLTVTNSLHKFLKGNNHSDFSFSELKKSIREIEELTSIPSDCFQVISLEFALNITTHISGYEYLPLFTNFKSKEFDKMRAKSFWYGNKYVLSDYAIKIYDKPEMVKKAESIKLPYNGLRFEIQYFRQRRIPSIKTLADLNKKENIIALNNDLIKLLNKIGCIGLEDFSQVDSRDREIYYAGQSQNFWKCERSLNIHTFKDKKKRFERAQKSITTINLMDEFIAKMEAKFKALINS